MNNSKNNILQCALTLFSEKGYDAVGINEITQKAGITKPTLYYFFQSKEGVFKAILEEYYVDFNHRLEMVCRYTPNAQNYEQDVFPVLVRIAEMYFAFAGDNTSFYLMLLSLLFAPPTAQTAILTRPYVKEQYRIMIQLFEAISMTHHNLKGKEEKCASYLIAMINTEIGFWYQGMGSLGTDKARKLVHQFMHGIFA